MWMVEEWIRLEPSLHIQTFKSRLVAAVFAGRLLAVVFGFSSRALVALSSQMLVGLTLVLNAPRGLGSMWSFLRQGMMGIWVDQDLVVEVSPTSSETKIC